VQIENATNKEISTFSYALERNFKILAALSNPLCHFGSVVVGQAGETQFVNLFPCVVAAFVVLMVVDS